MEIEEYIVGKIAPNITRQRKHEKNKTTWYGYTATA